MRKKVSWLLAAATIFAASPALAQQEQDDSYQYIFDDESLLGDAIWGHTPEIKIRKEPKRVLLIRPRGSFVPELQKSVEDI